MTKAQELAALSAFMGSLPPGSYLRVWLSGVVDEVARDIASDHFSSVSPADTRALCVQLERDAVSRAESIVKRAENEAAGILKAARAEADRIQSRINHARESLRRSVLEL